MYSIRWIASSSASDPARGSMAPDRAAVLGGIGVVGLPVAPAAPVVVMALVVAMALVVVMEGLVTVVVAGPLLVLVVVTGSVIGAVLAGGGEWESLSSSIIRITGGAAGRG